jgi:hypothetical protein
MSRRGSVAVETPVASDRAGLGGSRALRLRPDLGQLRIYSWQWNFHKKKDIWNIIRYFDLSDLYHTIENIQDNSI